jgi:hypothetical protein
MALFGGMFGGGAQKHANLDQLTLAIHNCLNLQLAPPGADVLAITEAMTHLDLVGFQNAHNVEGMQELLRAKSLRATIDPTAQTLTLSIATHEEIDRELKHEHGAVKVLPVGNIMRARAFSNPSPLLSPIKARQRPRPTAQPQPRGATARIRSRGTPLPRGHRHVRQVRAVDHG